MNAVNENVREPLILFLAAVLFCLLSSRLSSLLVSVSHAQPASYGESVGVILTKTGLSPSPLRIRPGATVSWVNRSNTSYRIFFPYLAVSASCKAPRGFKIERTGIRESKLLAPGKVASLCFLNPGRYRYEVKTDLPLSSEPQTPPLADGSGFSETPLDGVGASEAKADDPLKRFDTFVGPFRDETPAEQVFQSLIEVEN